MTVRYHVLLLTADATFGRMLQLELEAWQLSVFLSEAVAPDVTAAVTVVDLDSAGVPPEPACGYLIGFSRLPALSADEEARRCSMILRRPFQMSLLRREVLSQLAGIACIGAEAPQALPQPLLLTEQGAACGALTVALSPTERAILSALLQAHGAPVPRAELTALLGQEARAGAGGELTVYICTLRKKLRQLECQAALCTVRGVGYRLISSEKSGKHLTSFS